MLSKFRLFQVFHGSYFLLGLHITSVHGHNLRAGRGVGHSEPLWSPLDMHVAYVKTCVPPKWLQPQREHWFSPFTYCQDCLFHWQCLLVRASFTTQTWISHFDFVSRVDVPHPRRTSVMTELEEWDTLGKNIRLPLFFPKAQQFFNVSAFETCMPLVNSREWKWLFLSILSRFIVAFGEDDLLTSSLIHS